MLIMVFEKSVLNKTNSQMFLLFFKQIFAIFSPIALVLSYFLVPAKNKSTLTLPHVLSISPMFLWLAVFLFQPHKEERLVNCIYLRLRNSLLKKLKIRFLI